MDEEAFLDTSAAAEYLGISIQSLKAMRSRGRGPKFRRLPNRRVDYKKSWLDEFSDAHTVEPTSEAA